MAWTTPRDWVAGEVVTAAIMNTHVRDDFNYLKAQEDWAAVTFAAGNFTANGAQTWTVASGDMLVNRYQVVGKTLRWQLGVNTSTVGGTPNTQLRATLPGSKLAASRSIGFARVSDNGAAVVVSVWYAGAAGDSYIAFYTTVAASGNWAAATDTTTVEAFIEIEIQ